MGRLFGLILSLLGGIALGIGAFNLLTPPLDGFVSIAGAQALGLAILPGMALWFGAWIAFVLDGLQRSLHDLQRDTAQMGGKVSRLAKGAEAAAQARREPSLTRRS